MTRSVHSPRRLDRSQLADLCRDVGRRDERLAHQHGVGSGHSHTLHLVAGEEPALADDDVARGNPGQQLERRLDPRVERRQVTVVDADDAGADGQRGLQLAHGVTLHQGGQPDALGGLEQVSQLGCFEDRHDQQHRVGAGSARLPELVLGQREVLAQERYGHGAADGVEQIEMTVEILLVGQHRDGVGAVTGVGGGEGDRVERRRERAP